MVVVVVVLVGEVLSCWKEGKDHTQDECRC